MSDGYPVPAESVQTEIVINKSRFLTTAELAASVAGARERRAALRSELASANHHVYAFRVGFGNSITEGMSDDGEPTGTAGPPTLAVLRGAGIGDILLVTARYFGGVKLGTGGLARAYTASAQEALRALKTELKIQRQTVGLELPYTFYNLAKRLIAAHSGTIEDEVFDEQVLVIVRFVAADLDRFAIEIRERTAGQVLPIALS
ncbi:MAG: IMPACT family protein [Chloroflexi bacterium]|nr:IMPACT family protein [Chloroflexota bacterium]